MIQIENLTKMQRVICDVLWSLDSKDQVLNFIRALPQKERAMAVGLYHLMIIETLDQNMDIEDLSLAKQVIDKVK
jgi:hypothetical protein